MNARIRSPLVCLVIMLALLATPSALAAPPRTVPSANLPVTLSFSPNPVNVGSQVQIQISITGGVSPYYIWFNSSIPNCNPSSQPIQQSSPSASYPCSPSSTGSFPAHVDVSDSVGNQGSASQSLSVTGSGGNTSGNGTGGIDLSFLQNMLPVLLIVMIVFLVSMVAMAASFVALAVLIPRRLKQLRKSLEGQTVPRTQAAEPVAAPPPKPPEDQL